MKDQRPTHAAVIVYVDGKQVHLIKRARIYRPKDRSDYGGSRNPSPYVRFAGGHHAIVHRAAANVYTIHLDVDEWADYRRGRGAACSS